MALKNKTVEAWIGEGLVIPYGPITDKNGANISFASTTITHRITTKPGGGDTINSETAVNVSGDEAFTVTIAASVFPSTLTPKVYYHEVSVNPAAGDPYQLQAPSRFVLHASAIT